MCSMSVLCPLCAHTSFNSIDALRHSLIQAANGPLACPICHEQFLGLDKLTIHLFSHSTTVNNVPNNILSTEVSTSTDVKIPNAVATSPNNSPQHLVAVTSKEKRSKKLKPTKAAERAAVEQPKQQQQVEENPISEQTPPLNTNTDTLVSCDICEFTFRNAELRDMHFRLVHQNYSPPGPALNAPADCHSDASNGVNNAHETDFKCHLCSKRFKLKVHLKVHLKVVHLIGVSYSNSNSPKLTICDRIRRKETNTKLQSNFTQPTPTTKIISQVPPIAAMQPPNSPPQFTNAISTLTLLSATPFHAAELTAVHTTTGNVVGSEVAQANAVGNDTLNANMVLVFNGTSSQNDADSSSKDTCDDLYKATSLDTNPKIWECDVCAKAFTTKYFLKKHKRLHTGEMPYTCEICARTFTFQQSYHKHLLYHSDEKPHVCTTCGRAFKELSTLHNHERIHSGEKPFKCEVCGKCFRQRVSFLVHTRIHTGIMPYKCEVCHKSFRYKVSQRTHKCLIKLTENLPTPTSTTSTIKEESRSEPADSISEHFIKAFLESTTAELAKSAQQNSPASNEIATINASGCATEHLGTNSLLEEALLSKTIDDIVVESCNKLGIANNDTLDTPPAEGNINAALINGFVGSHCGSIGGSITTTTTCSDGSNSPLDKLQHMHLYSPQLVRGINGMEGGVSEGFTHFLLDDANNHLL